MVSAIDRAKRTFVTLLKTLAATYGVALQLKRDSTDAEVNKAFRSVSRRVHPDQGGSVADQTRLNAARDDWQDTVQQAAGKHGRRGAAHTGGQDLATAPEKRKEFQVQSTGVLLTYQKFANIGVWTQLPSFCGRGPARTGGRFW